MMQSVVLALTAFIKNSGINNSQYHIINPFPDATVKDDFSSDDCF